MERLARFQVMMGGSMTSAKKASGKKISLGSTEREGLELVV